MSIKKDNLTWEQYWNQISPYVQKLVDDYITIEKRKIYCIGDCMTAGIGVEKGYDYPLKLQEILGDNYKVINLGRTMLKMEWMIKYLKLFIPESSNKNDLALIWIGTNDLYDETSTPNIILNLLQNYCKILQEKGIVCVIITLLPHSNKAPVTMEPNRQIYNQLIRDNFSRVIDLGSDENIGLLGKEFDPKYYNQQDNTHLNEYGHAYIADKISMVVKDL